MEHGHNVLPDLLAHRYFVIQGSIVHRITEPHSLELDLGDLTAAARSGCSCTEKSILHRHKHVRADQATSSRLRPMWNTGCQRKVGSRN